jgi:hypothetical protein
VDTSRIVYEGILQQGRSRIRRVAELLDEHGHWKTDLVQSIFLPIDADVILKIKTSRRRDEDIIGWQPEKSGLFIVKSAYNLAFTNSPVQCEFAATSSRPEGDDICWKRVSGQQKFLRKLKPLPTKLHLMRLLQRGIKGLVVWMLQGLV